MKTSAVGIELIKKYEGLKLQAYVCPGGVLTVGYGHTKNVKENMILTPQDAEELLIKDLEYFEEKLIDVVKVKINQNQFDALISLIYNIGEGAFNESSLLKFINDNKFDLAARQFPRWIYSNGKILTGLVNRRKAEREIFEYE
ncbi:MAG: lysozyme [Candidatus Roizmanbacteria bacterium]|nr:lysozyme [Candidatus Roizmanbacteria bacterium]